MDKNINVSKITLDNHQEYYILDKIEDTKFNYLFLAAVLDNDILLRKYEKTHKNECIYKLDNLDEMAHAFNLFFKKHPELKNSL